MCIENSGKCYSLASGRCACGYNRIQWRLNRQLQAGWARVNVPGGGACGGAGAEVHGRSMIIFEGVAEKQGDISNTGMYIYHTYSRAKYRLPVRVGEKGGGMILERGMKKIKNGFGSFGKGGITGKAAADYS